MLFLKPVANGQCSALPLNYEEKNMNKVQFMSFIEDAFVRRKEILRKKEKLYSDGRDRLEQFYRAGAAQNILPTEALIGMAAKHFTVIADMCKDPSYFTANQWNESLDDLRNYMDLLDALVTDVN
jgi:hypothetical protein